MFSFASSKLRANKYGNFSSIDSWSSSERMFAKDGYNERWYRTSDCTYNTVVEMNHPETQSNDNTDSKSAVYTADASIKSLPNLFLFSNDCSTRTSTLFVTTSGFYYYSSLIRGNYSRLYWRYYLKISIISSLYQIQNCYLLLVMLLLPEFSQSINQSV